MKKFHFVFNILKRRVANIVLLSIMFSSLLLIFMVGLSIKDIFYDYLRSDYGNIPDMKVKLHNVSSNDVNRIKSKINALDNSIDILYGYENIYDLTITDSEELLLASKMPVLVKGITLERKVDVILDGVSHKLPIVNFEYEEGLNIELNVSGIDVKDKDSLAFTLKDKTLNFDFCRNIALENEILSLQSTPCKDDVDNLLEKIEAKNISYINLKIDDEIQKLHILELDPIDRTLTLEYTKETEPKHLAIMLENLTIDENLIEQFEVYDGNLFVNFQRDENTELSYKRLITKMLQNQINYNRFVLKVKNYSFAQEDDEEEDKKSQEELTRLNELTDFIDMMLFTNGNSAISSDYMANDLNNFGVLDNFTIKVADNEFMANIRSTFYYKPEKIYKDNILIFNNKVLQNELNVGDLNNYIDVYLSQSNFDKIDAIKHIVLSVDKDAKFIAQDEIIPSIAPKKKMFNGVVITFSIFIFGILFVAMYVVLRQFYSNFESELALLKLFGSNQPYQTYINIISLVFSLFITFYVLKNQQEFINMIMQKYFFMTYNFDLNNYFISVSVLGVYVVVIYLLEFISIKKLNIIKGQ